MTKMRIRIPGRYQNLTNEMNRQMTILGQIKRRNLCLVWRDNNFCKFELIVQFNVDSLIIISEFC